MLDARPSSRYAVREDIEQCGLQVGLRNAKARLGADGAAPTEELFVQKEMPHLMLPASLGPAAPRLRMQLEPRVALAILRCC